MNTLDILSMHNAIVRKFQQNEKQESESNPKEAPSDIIGSASENMATGDNHEFYYYMLRAIPLMDRYCLLKKSQKKISFVRNRSEEPEDTSQQMGEIVREYLLILEKYFPDEFHNSQWNALKASDDSREGVARLMKKSCLVCNNEQESFSIYDNHFVCDKCGYVCSTTHNSMSYKDIDRVNISSKYTYDRRTHFRDCINQFQGKQNASIDPKVYDDVIEQLVLHGLIPVNHRELPKKEAFKDISKEQVLIFLKETGHSKHYEDVVLIHYQLTDKSPPDISHLENDLLRDFDMLTDLYDKKYKNSQRKNFINTQYVLFQLLRRHKFPCKKEDFNILKTVDRKYYHDTICADLFLSLGWNFQALF